MAWNPSLHPRDPRTGRFTKSYTKAATRTERRRADRASKAFGRTRFSGRQAALGWHAANAGVLTPEQRTAATGLLSDRKRQTNTALRTTGAGADRPDVVALDEAMTPLAEDVLLSRRVSLAMFQGVSPGDLVGRKIKDAGYFPASVTPARKRLDAEVRMQIKAPAGTPAIVVPDDPDGQVILPRDLELVIESATPDGRGGWDMTLVVLPKTGATGERENAGGALPKGVELRSEAGYGESRDVYRDGEPVGAAIDNENGTFTAVGADGNTISDSHVSRDESVAAVLAHKPDATPVEPTTTPAAERLAPVAEPAAPIRTVDEAKAAIRGAYEAVRVRSGKRHNAFLLVSQVRAELSASGMTRAQVDEALVALNSDPDVAFATEANKKALSRADKDAAIRIGNQNKDLIAIEGATASAPPRSAASTIADIAAEIQGAYLRIAASPGSPVLISRIRAALDGRIPRARVDDALRKLSRDRTGNLVTEPNRKALSAADEAAAISLGRQDKHLLVIDDPAGGSSDRSAPAREFREAPAADMEVWTASRSLAPEQSAALRSYTGEMGDGSYATVNGHLRAGRDPERAYEPTRLAIETLSSAMAPLPMDTRVYRQTNFDQFGVVNAGELQGQVGRTFRDQGFSSTSIVDDNWLEPAEIKLVVNVPAGTPSAYIGARSRYAHEKELLLDRGASFEIQSVTPDPGGGPVVVEMTVVGGGAV